MDAELGRSGPFGSASRLVLCAGHFGGLLPGHWSLLGVLVTVGCRRLLLRPAVVVAAAVGAPRLLLLGRLVLAPEHRDVQDQ